MTSVAAPSTTDYLLRFGSADQFAAVRDCFIAAKYDEPTVARRLGGASMFGFPRLSDGRRSMAGPVGDANAALIRLFLDDEPLPAALVTSLCGESATMAMQELGMLSPDPADATLLRSTVLLAPVSGVWVAQDTPPRDGLNSNVVPRDVVFPALNDLTREFMDVVADRPGERLLELCAGAGLGALRGLRRGVGEAWATDITGRSVHFARWNAALNGLDAVHAVVADVWTGLEGETFDHVIAHPPYVPALAHVFDFRDAGADGEQVTRRIVEGLPVHLRVGGRCSITCALTDRKGEPAEQRIRRWLGAAEGEFDLVVMHRRDWDSMHAYRNVSGQKTGFVDAERWLAHFDSLGVQQFVLTSFELRRTAAGRPPLTIRRHMGKKLDGAAIDWQFRWARQLDTSVPPLERLSGVRPFVTPGTRLEVLLQTDAARDWHTVGATVKVDYPATDTVPAPSITPTLLELCDGTRDVPMLLDALREAGLVSDDVTLVDVAGVIEQLLTAGALEFAGSDVPRIPTTS